MQEKPQRTALLSVFNKTGIVEFARGLLALGNWQIISSGGTAQALMKADIPVTDVADITGFPAILGHKVVTLAPQIHAGLLASPEERDELRKYGYLWIDLCCVDLYPLEEEIAKPDATRASITAKTDIGGPTMLRSAAKGRRIVISFTEQREQVLEWLHAGEPNPEQFLERLAGEAEATVADYCGTSAASIMGIEIRVIPRGINEPV